MDRIDLASGYMVLRRVGWVGFFGGGLKRYLNIQTETHNGIVIPCILICYNSILLLVIWQENICNVDSGVYFN